MVCKGMLFPKFYETSMDIMFFCCFSSWLAEGLVMALTAVILNTFSYFTFHLHSLYKIVSLFFLGGVHHCEKKK